MKRLFVILILFATLLISLSGCSKPDSSAEEAQSAVPVEVASVALGTVVQSLTYSGDIKAEFEVKVFSKIPDRIEKFYVDDGQSVAKGALIAKIFAATIEQAVRQAEATLAATKAQAANLQVEYERAQRLHRESAMSKQQYDAFATQYEATQAQVKQVEAVLASAKSSLSDATVTAPISGIVGKRYYEEGDMAAPTMPLVTIVQMDRVKITFNATENDLGKLTSGLSATIKVSSYPDVVFKGLVNKISPILDPMTRMAEVEVLVDNPGHKLKPGMYAQVEVTTGKLEKVIVVPRSAAIENTVLRKVGNEDQVMRNYYVFVVENDRAIQRKLDVKYVNHVHIAVNSGIKIGETFVTTGQNNLRDSTLVSIVKKEGDQS